MPILAWNNKNKHESVQSFCKQLVDFSCFFFLYYYVDLYEDFFTNRNL